MALIDLTLEKPALKRTEVIESEQTEASPRSDAADRSAATTAEESELGTADPTSRFADRHSRRVLAIVATGAILGIIAAIRRRSGT